MRDAGNDPLRWDVILYAGCAVFAAGLGALSGLPNHQAWARVAMIGYAAAALIAFGQLALSRRGAQWPATVAARGVVAGAAWLATAVGPMLWLAHHGRAQEEVGVIERAGGRWLAEGTPYLARDEIARLPAGEWLAAYTPYQPGMAVFGLPRALDPAAEWWSDARIWFALATVAVLAAALAVLGWRLPLRAVQAVTVLPTAALATAVGGDDLPVLALCLLALALAARERFGAAGLVVGAAAALKLIAWPLAVVLAVLAATRGREPLTRFGWGAGGVPAVTLLPAVLANPAAVLENAVRFPLGGGLVSSPAQAPLPGHLIANGPGRAVAVGLLVGAGLLVAGWLWLRPPRTAAAAALVGGYGLLLAIALMPATRFGYLLYPVALLAWVPVLRTPAREEVRADGPMPGGHERLPAAAGGGLEPEGLGIVSWRRPPPGWRWWPATPAAHRTRSGTARPGTW